MPRFSWDSPHWSCGGSNGLPAASRYAAVAAAASILGAVALGSAPYVHNVVEHHDPFYPATPKHGLLDTTSQVPANLLHADRVSRFLVSSFSRSETVRPPKGTRVKFPLSIGPQERRGLYSADLESGGFGPGTGRCSCWLVSRRSHSASGDHRDARRASSC